MDAHTRLAELKAVERLAAGDPTLFADPEIAATRLGWLGSPARAAADAARLADFAEDIASRGIRDVVLLGMGGSSLAPLVLSRAFRAAPGHPHLHVMDTTSPVEVDALLRTLEPALTFVLVSSKSGTTIEPLALFEVFRAWMEPALGERTGSYFAAVTDPGSPLVELAAEHGFRDVFLAPVDVGGRYAALTPFATVPGALMGVDVARLAAEGETMAAACRVPGDANPASRLAAWISDAYDSGRDKLTIVCSPSLASFGLWVEQLVAESTGKKGAGVLPVLEPAPGSPDAHGDDRMTFVLRTKGDDRLASLASRLPDNEPFLEVVVDGPYALGAEFVRWEWAVALFSALQGIEPFDQPDVEGAKTTTREILKGKREAPKSTILDRGIAITMCAGGEPADLDSALSMLLKGAGPRAYLAVLAYLPEDEAYLIPLRAACDEIAADRKMAVTLELGPRYLHSTGQYHKGGPAEGIYLVVTAQEPVSLAVPEVLFSLADLHRTQPAGDVATLVSLGRPVVAVELPAEDLEAVETLSMALRSAAH